MEIAAGESWIHLLHGRWVHIMNNVLTLSIIMGLYSRASKMRVYAEVLLGEENALHDGISWSLLFQYHHRHL